MLNVCLFFGYWNLDFFFHHWILLPCAQKKHMDIFREQRQKENKPKKAHIL